jgi:hypothetical protein
MMLVGWNSSARTIKMVWNFYRIIKLSWCWSGTHISDEFCLASAQLLFGLSYRDSVGILKFWLLWTIHTVILHKFWEFLIDANRFLFWFLRFIMKVFILFLTSINGHACWNGKRRSPCLSVSQSLPVCVPVHLSLSTCVPVPLCPCTYPFVFLLCPFPTDFFDNG